MSVHVIKQSSVGYDEHGASVYSTETFVKIETSFLHGGALRQLKGAPLSVFICLALHEADADPGASLSTIETETGCSSPTVIKAIRFLQSPAHRFIDEIGAEDDGTKRYRVSAYAWFGNGRRSPCGSGKISLPPSSAKKVFTPVVVDSKPPSKKEQQQQQLFCAETKKILNMAGIGEPALSKLSATVVPERVEMWVDWLQDPPKSIRQPAAYLVKRLSDDPTSDPPGWTLALWYKWRADDELERMRVEEAENAPTLADAGDGAAEIWIAALVELRHQMPKATFDAWLRPSRALRLEHDQLVVGVHSMYAKEWLENRLHTIVERTVSGIVGRSRSVTVRYEVNGHER